MHAYFSLFSQVLKALLSSYSRKFATYAELWQQVLQTCGLEAGLR